MKVFDEVYDLADSIVDTINTLDHQDVVVIADYETISELIIELILYLEGEVELVDVLIQDCEYEKYNGPWLLTITPDYELYCERAVSEKGSILWFDGYLFTTPKYINKIMDDISGIEGCTLFKFSYDEDETEQQSPVPKELNKPDIDFSWNDDSHKGFVYCKTSEDGKIKQKFIYNGTQKLNGVDVMSIVHEWLD